MNATELCCQGRTAKKHLTTYDKFASIPSSLEFRLASFVDTASSKLLKKPTISAMPSFTILQKHVAAHGHSAGPRALTQLYPCETSWRRCRSHLGGLYCSCSRRGAPQKSKSRRPRPAALPVDENQKLTMVAHSSKPTWIIFIRRRRGWSVLEAKQLLWRALT